MTRFGGGSGSRAFVMSALVDVVCMICLIKGCSFIGWCCGVVYYVLQVEVMIF